MVLKFSLFNGTSFCTKELLQTALLNLENYPHEENIID